MRAGIPISAAVEGDIDEAVLRRIVACAGGTVGTVYGKKGRLYLQRKISAFNQAAQRWPWVVLADLDNDPRCAPLLVAEWLPSPAQHMCLRIAVREIESWLLADRERMAAFLSIPISRMPVSVEELDNPKGIVVSLAARSRRSEIRHDIFPRQGSGREVGPAYTSRMIEFVDNGDLGWRPEVAAERCQSLHRCLQSLDRLLEWHPS